MSPDLLVAADRAEFEGFPTLADALRRDPLPSWASGVHTQLGSTRPHYRQLRRDPWPFDSDSEEYTQEPRELWGDLMRQWSFLRYAERLGMSAEQIQRLADAFRDTWAGFGDD